MTKIVSYNVNGIRAALRKGLAAWLREENPELFCVQETKANVDQVDVSSIEELGYKHFWHSAEKKGYSGVACFSKKNPQHIAYGCGIESIDNEGRIIRLDFQDYSVLNVYMPSGSNGDVRQAFKISFLKDFYNYTQGLNEVIPNLIICGDFNICHKSIDIHDPIRNAKVSGFLPEEREWVSKFIDLGFIDTFREFCVSPERYSWWSYRANSRPRNKGWRIDYQMASLAMKSHLLRADILHHVFHSDHCPTLLEIDL